MSSQIIEILQRGANDNWHLGLSDTQLAQFSLFASLLIDWNENRLNLTSITTSEGIAVKHFLDSLSVLHAVPIPLGARIIDIGTGAGLPGIALKIARPDLRVTLLDSTAKKLGFCQAVIDALVLENIVIVHSRAEEACRQSPYAAMFDVAIARAVAPMEKLLPWTVPFLCAGGMLIAMKGAGVEAEMPAAIPLARRMGMRLYSPIAVPLPEADEPIVRQIVTGRRKSFA